MTTFNTGNPVPSTAIKDLYDNAENLDNLVNGPEVSYQDRLGVLRKSWAGMENDFSTFLAASGFEPDVLTYVDGNPLQVDRPTQLIERAASPGVLYSVKLPSAFPVVLSGTWAADEPLLVIRADDALRNQLANPASAALGAALVAHTPTLEYPEGTVGASLSGLIQRTVEFFGAIGDGVTNDTPALHDAFAWLQAAPGRTLVFGAGKTYLQGPGADEVIYEGNPYFPSRFNFVDQDNMKIVGNGATIAADPTLTDTQFNRGFQFLRCNNLTIWDLTYDGRLDARTPFGGDLFNGGNELTGNAKQGFEFVRCYDAVLYRVRATRCMMDGFTPTYEFGFPGADSESKRLWFIDCESTYNYRQGMSIIGASFCRIEGGQYSQTGALGVGKGTNPMAGIDIEANEDNEFKRCAHNTFIGVEFRNNRQGLAFAFGAQYNQAINCKFIENRLYGTSFALTGCEGNTVEGGQIVQTQATTESAPRAATIGRNRNGLIGVHIQIATPHRGVDFENAATCTDCFVYDCLLEDVAPATDVTSLPFLLNTLTNNVRPMVKRNTFLNGTGTGHMVTLDCATGDFTDNKINSIHGVAGARGLTAIKAGLVVNNSGAGTRTDTAVQQAVFNLAGSATLVKQLGPNLDEANPRIGAQTRRLGFTAPPFYGSAVYDPPSLADGEGASTTVTVTGAALNDFATASFSLSVAGLTITADVTAANTVTVRFQNESGGVLNIGSGTLFVKVTN